VEELDSMNRDKAGSAGEYRYQMYCGSGRKFVNQR
jgi:hypothetical protein